MTSLKQFCSTHNINYEVANGLKYAESSPGILDTYRLVGADTADEVTLINIVPYGRFGNNILQLVHAILFAKKTGIKKISITGLFEGMKIASLPQEVLDIQFVNMPLVDESDSLALEGRFFFWWSLNGFFEAAPPKVVATIKQYILPLLGLEGGQGANDRTLHVHFRGGDVFAGDAVNAEYVQPPLSYYLSAYEDVVSQSQIDHVVIVYEDFKNPCVNQFLNILQNRNVQVSLQTGSLESDVMHLLSARQLIAGFGTFVPMIGLMSTHLKTIYFFNNGQRVAEFLYKGCSVKLIKDKALHYIKRGEWTNSAIQRELMINYPKQNLSEAILMNRTI